MYATSRGVGQYVASEAHVIVRGRRTKVGEPVIVCQGSHGVANHLWWFSDADSLVRTQSLAAQGFFQISGDLSQTTSQGTFGNATAATRVGQLKSYLQGVGVTGPAHLRSGSGGFAAAVRYAKANPGNVKSITGMNPLVDLRNLYTGGSYSTAEIDQAFVNAGTTYAAGVAAANASEPGTLAPLASIPFLLCYATDDPYIPVSTVTAFKTALEAVGGSCQLVSMGAVGHTAPLTGVSNDVLNEFLATHV